jgi:hypothetical protein
MGLKGKGREGFCGLSRAWLGGGTRLSPPLASFFVATRLRAAASRGTYPTLPHLPGRSTPGAKKTPPTVPSSRAPPGLASPRRPAGQDAFGGSNLCYNGPKIVRGEQGQGAGRAGSASVVSGAGQKPDGDDGSASTATGLTLRRREQRRAPAPASQPSTAHAHTQQTPSAPFFRAPVPKRPGNHWRQLSLVPSPSPPKGPLLASPRGLASSYSRARAPGAHRPGAPDRTERAVDGSSRATRGQTAGRLCSRVVCAPSP